MSLIDENELIQWTKHKAVQFPDIDQNVLSYFQVFCNESIFSELSFRTVSELEEKIADMWGMDSIFHDLCLFCASAAFSNKPDLNLDDTKNKYSISDYIYAF